MRPISIVDAPSVLGLFPRGVETLPDALHAHDFVDRVGATVHRSLTPPAYSARPDPMGINNARALVTFAETLAEAVGAELDDGAFPLVLGGDCSIVFGPLLALARRGRSGLLFLDGHADFAHPADDAAGEAASMDLALATGRGPEGFGPIGGHRPLIADDRVALLAYRVRDDGTDRHLDLRVEDTAITTIDLPELRRRGVDASIADALSTVARDDLDGFWIHVDADVLDDALMPAVDYRTPDGLSWEELTAIARAAVASGRARGLDLTIFNPRLDPDGTLAERLVAFLVDAVS
jgi:arginase